MCVLSDSSLFLALFFSGSLCFLFWWVAKYLWSVGRGQCPGGEEYFNHGVGDYWPHKWIVRQDLSLSFLFTPLTSGSLPCLEEIHLPFLVFQVIVILFWRCELTCYRRNFMESCRSVTILQIEPLAWRWGWLTWRDRLGCPNPFGAAILTAFVGHGIQHQLVRSINSDQCCV